MVEAGEAGGALPQTLRRIVELQERHLEIRERVRSALIYPALLAGVVLLTLVMLLTVVLPRFDVMFADSIQSLPTITRVALALGRTLADHGWEILAGIAASTVLFVKWLNTPGGRRRFDTWLLGTPLVVSLPKDLNAARFLRTVSMLCENGTTLPASTNYR